MDVIARTALITMTVIATLIGASYVLDVARCSIEPQSVSGYLWRATNCPLPSLQVPAADNRPSSSLPHDEHGSPPYSATSGRTCDSCVRAGTADCHAQCI